MHEKVTEDIQKISGFLNRGPLRGRGGGVVKPPEPLRKNIFFIKEKDIFQIT